MLVRIIVCALVAGGIAGAFSALMQQSLVIPVLLEAELYERGGAVHFAGATPAHGAAELGHGAAGHGDADTEQAHGQAAAPIKRHLVTAVMTVGINVGFALLLVAGFFAIGARPSPREGLVWGICGFAAFMLAPAAGLAPELPGVAAAPLEVRQIWWVVTVALAAGAIWLIAFVRTVWALPAAVALLAAPHLYGAPLPDGHAGLAPPELAAAFAARVLVIGFASWAVLGAAAAWIWDRQGAGES